MIIFEPWPENLSFLPNKLDTSDLFNLIISNADKHGFSSIWKRIFVEMMTWIMLTAS